MGRGRSRRRRPLLLLALTGVILFAACVGIAIAATQSYCGTLVAARSQCPQRSSFFTFINQNTASYPGSGSVSVCQRIENVAGGLVSRTCGNNITRSPSSRYGATQGVVGNNDDGRHTINGSVRYE